jgi:hypothetical protein
MEETSSGVSKSESVVRAISVTIEVGSAIRCQYSRAPSGLSFLNSSTLARATACFVFRVAHFRAEKGVRKRGLFSSQRGRVWCADSGEGNAALAELSFKDCYVLLQSVVALLFMDMATALIYAEALRKFWPSPFSIGLQ